ncbi:response regulator transcription factor [Geomicrobium sp. JSM 1781026]|uniref:response regulator transcription factor n=1 Tax=Geomicrobium sp. JSM 1781026 TaxID=3344580 RepID=UPI0035C034EB
MTSPRILLVEDDNAIRTMLHKVLQKEGFQDVDGATTQKQALTLCHTHTYDFILLDVMLPDGDGFEICRQIRHQSGATIFFVTAKDSDFDKLSGFAIGGDDYITKPFNPLEIVARIRARLLRPASAPSTDASSHAYERFTIDARAGTLTVLGERTSCPALVFQLLLFFCRHPGQVFHKEQLYEKVWGDEHYYDAHTVTVHIRRIREKIEANPSKPEYIETVRGLGYRFIPDGDGS